MVCTKATTRKLAILNAITYGLQIHRCCADSFKRNIFSKNNWSFGLFGEPEHLRPKVLLRNVFASRCMTKCLARKTSAENVKCSFEITSIYGCYITINWK